MWDKLTKNTTEISVILKVQMRGRTVPLPIACDPQRVLWHSLSRALDLCVSFCPFCSCIHQSNAPPGARDSYVKLRQRYHWCLPPAMQQHRESNLPPPLNKGCRFFVAFIVVVLLQLSMAVILSMGQVNINIGQKICWIFVVERNWKRLDFFK